MAESKNPPNKSLLCILSSMDDNFTSIISFINDKVTMEEESCVEKDGYHIELVPLWKWLLSF